MTGTAACTASRVAWRRCRPRSPRRRRRRGGRRAPSSTSRGISGSSRASTRSPSRLTERDQAHAGRDEVGGEGLRERLRRLGERQAVGGRAGADRDRVGHLAPLLPSRSNSGCGQAAMRGGEERRALRQRLQPPLGRRRERRRQLGDVVEPRRRRRQPRPARPRPGRSRRCVRRRAPARPRSSRRAWRRSCTLPVSTTHSSPCE